MLSLNKNHDLVNFLSIFIFPFFLLFQNGSIFRYRLSTKNHYFKRKLMAQYDYAWQSACHDLSQSIRCKNVMRRLFFLHVTETFLVVKKQIQAEFVDYL